MMVEYKYSCRNNLIVSLGFKDMDDENSLSPFCMRQFASNYPDISIVQELLAQLSWYHNITIMQKIKDDKSNLYPFILAPLYRAKP